MLFVNHSETADNQIVIIDVKGPLNHSSSHDFEKYIDKLMGKGNYLIIIDALELEYVSSGGIGVLLYIHNMVSRKNGFLILCNISSEIFSLFKLLGFDKVLNTSVSREDAIQRMEKQIELKSNDPYFEPVQLRSPTEKLSTEKEPTADQAEDTVSDNETDSFAKPLIVECEKCKGLIRVKKTGAYQCPFCRTEFKVDQDLTVAF